MGEIVFLSLCTAIAQPVTSAYKTTQMYIGSLFSGKKRKCTPALSFLQVDRDFHFRSDYRFLQLKISFSVVQDYKTTSQLQTTMF